MQLGEDQLSAMPGFSGTDKHSTMKSSPRVSGFEDIPRPFVIGVGGGTASGKVKYSV